MQTLPHERFNNARNEFNAHGKQSMGQVAKATGVPQSVISDLERDPHLDADHASAPRKVAYQTVAALARHYGVSADYLLGLSEDPDRAPGAVDELGLSPTAVKRLREVKRNADREDEPDGPFHKRLSALDEILREPRFSSFLTYFMLARMAAEQTKEANRQFAAQALAKKTGQPLPPVSYRNRESYAYQKYLCLQQFEKLLDAFCSAEDLEG